MRVLTPPTRTPLELGPPRSTLDAVRSTEAPRPHEPAVVVSLSSAAREALAQQRADGDSGSVEADEAELLARSEAVARDEELQQLRGELSRAKQRELDEQREADEAKEAEAPGQLSEEEQEQVDVLKARDREVRAHEQAHVAAAGGFAGTPTYETVAGPDGRAYAVAGHVAIDTAPESTPEATAAKMRAVRAAATASSDPSAADARVAAKADAQLNKALTSRALAAYSAASEP